MAIKSSKLDVSLFLKAVGDCIRNRVLEFFIEGREFDYPVKYLAEEIGVNRNTIYHVIEELISNNLLLFSRRIGSSKFYKINLSDSIAIDLVRLFDKIINMKISEYVEKENHYSKDGIIDLKLISETDYYKINYVSHGMSIPTANIGKVNEEFVTA